MADAVADSAIKLFGKTIAFLPDKVFAVTEQRQSSSSESNSQDMLKHVSAKELKTNKHEHEPTDPSESAASSDSLSENSLDKPENLPPCPRCQSNDTKFCYYNNYNIKQPRHFCKSCQRYWTIGGTTRNVPIGSGRRKNKSPSYHHLMLFDTLKGTRPYPTNNFLIFGSQNHGPKGFCERSGRALGPSGFPIMFYPVTREENASKKIRAERSSVLVPKTLRIDDPNEAAKSSIWSTLGIENEKISSTNKTCHFEAFETKGDSDLSIDSATMVLRANPAALSRSINFHEST